MKIDVTASSVSELAEALCSAVQALTTASFSAGEGGAYSAALRDAGRLLEGANLPEGVTFTFECSPKVGGGSTLKALLPGGLVFEVFSVYFDTFATFRSRGKCHSYASEHVVRPTFEFLSRVRG